jgi:hypothetical protein
MCDFICRQDSSVALYPGYEFCSTVTGFEKHPNRSSVYRFQIFTTLALCKPEDETLCSTLEISLDFLDKLCSVKSVSRFLGEHVYFVTAWRTVTIG